MKKAWLYITLLIGGVVLGYLLLVVAYLVPAPMMIREAYESAQTLKEEGDYWKADANENSQLDTFTDALMMETACYPGNESAFEKAAYAYRLAIQGKGPNESFILQHSPPATTASERVDYTRYWHGYLVTLRPLFTVLNYDRLRIVNLIVQCMLTAVIVMLIGKRVPQYMLPFLITMAFFVPEAVVRSLQFSSMIYVMLVSLLVLLAWYRPSGDSGRLIPFFLMIGMATAYLDLLTFPTVTLTMPLCMLCILDQDEWDSYQHRMKRLLFCCLG